MAREKSRPTGRTYGIRTLDDLSRVPDDRLGACLEAMRMTLIAHRHLHAAVAAVAARDGLTHAIPPFPGWTWTDDGERVVSVHTTVLPESEATHADSD